MENILVDFVMSLKLSSEEDKLVKHFSIDLTFLVRELLKKNSLTFIALLANSFFLFFFFWLIVSLCPEFTESRKPYLGIRSDFTYTKYSLSNNSIISPV